jgi:XTP/dITP diphosphohydrolase
MKVYCATTNAGKLREFRLAGADVEQLPNLREIPASPEDFESFEENAAQKAVYYSGFADGLVFADDSGLAVDALNGAPGVRSARYSGEHATDEQNNALLLKNIQNQSDRHAIFVCVIALARQGGLLATFRGEVEGEIVDTPLGTGGFGYDPLFFYPPFGKTLAEIPAEEKFQVSHRGRALRQLVKYLAELNAKESE